MKHAHNQEAPESWSQRNQCLAISRACYSTCYYILKLLVANFLLSCCSGSQQIIQHAMIIKHAILIAPTFENTACFRGQNLSNTNSWASGRSRYSQDTHMTLSWQNWPNWSEFVSNFWMWFQQNFDQNPKRGQTKISFYWHHINQATQNSK